MLSTQVGTRQSQNLYSYEYSCIKFYTEIFKTLINVIIVATIMRRRYEINFIYGNLIDRQEEASNSYGII